MNTSTKNSFFLWEGILYTLLGLIVLIRPFPSSLIIELMIAMTILLSGVTQVIRSFELSKMNIKSWPFLVDGIIAIIVGALLLFYPLPSITIIATIIMIYFIMESIFKFIGALVLSIGAYSYWLIANSLILALLVLYIWKNWADVSHILLGALVGINLLSSGIMRVLLSTKDLSLSTKE